jgi:hypothetical protein
VYMPNRISGPAARIAATSVAILAFAGAALHAQTAPQLLPYTAKVLAGGGSTAATAGSTCSRAGATPSGNVSYDAYGDGCLATEISSGGTNGLDATSAYGPRYVITDSTGAIYFGDWNNGLVRRIDPATGVVTAIGGGASSNPTSGATCSGTRDPRTVATGDLWGDGCLGTSIKLNYVAGMAFSPSGDLYIADRYNYNVRKMSFSNGGVAAVILTNGGGTGYATAPTVTFSAPASGTTATGTATINSSGVVTGVTITNAGSGYSANAMPTVTFSASPAGITATGKAVYTGVISMAVGNMNGTSTASATEKGYLTTAAAGTGITTVTSCSTAVPGTQNTAPFPCVLYEPYAIVFDAAGNLYIDEEYEYAVMVLNTNTTVSTTVTGLTVPPQTMIKIAGSKASGAPCETGETSAGGCSAGVYTSGTASTNELYNPYGVALDTSGNVYIADEEYSNVAKVNSSTGNIASYAGQFGPLTGTSATVAQSKRAPAGFAIGSNFGLGVDSTNNLYVTDAWNGYVWRVDATSQTMYVVGGGATTVCTPPAGTLTDTYGDGCPALQATFSSDRSTTFASYGVWGIYPDSYGNIFVGDEYNGLVREIASGTQFGNTGASATDVIDVHFPAGELPPSPASSDFTVATTSPASTTVFTIGTVTCTTNTDNNPTYGNTTDCLVPITASPSTPGPYTGTLTVTYPLSSGTSTISFPLSGNFASSPVTRIAIASASTIASCSGSTYATVTPVTLTASLTANGPSAPTGTITFYTGPSGSLTQIGTPQTVTNIGTSASPIYGAILTYTFSTAGTYNVTAVYTPTNGSYFQSSTNSTTVVSQAPSFTLTPSAYQQATVTRGQTALYSFTISQANYTGTIGFTVSGLPANTTYSFSPSTITGAGCVTTSTVAFSIYTQQQTTVQPAAFMAGRGLWRLLTAIGAVLLALAIGLRRRRIRFAQVWMSLALLLATTGMVACGKPAGSVLQPQTPVGTYTVTVTPTSSVGTAPASITFQLIVQ